MTHQTKTAFALPLYLLIFAACSSANVRPAATSGSSHVAPSAVTPATDQSSAESNLSPELVVRTEIPGLAYELLKALDALNADIKMHPEWNFHSLLVSRHGQLIFEEYYTGVDQKWGDDLGLISFDRDKLHDLRSVTKSIISALIGIAIHEGEIHGVDQRVCDFFPERSFPGKKEETTIRHLLTMTTGLRWDELTTSYSSAENDSSRILLSKNPVTFVLDRPLVSTPGEVFNYNGGSTEVLAEVLQRATKMPLRQYFETKLWLPLDGKTNGYEWGGRKDGAPAAEFGLRIRPSDLMRFANLFVNGGKYGQKQIVPIEWVADVSQTKIKSVPEPMAARFTGYSYQWWLPKIKGAENEDVFAALGNGGQSIVIFPKQKVVFVTTAGHYNKPGTTFPMLLEKHIVPAIVRRNHGGP